MQLKVFLAMLRHTPNLSSLSLDSGCTVRYTNGDEFSDLQLRKMEKLTLSSSAQVTLLLELFSRMCPQLKDFALPSEYRGYYHRALEMIRRMPSLEGISLVSSYDDFSNFVGLDHQFKRVSIILTRPWRRDPLTDRRFNENLIRFSHKQPLLECFEIEVRELKHNIRKRVLKIVFQNLPRLKRLSMKFYYKTFFPYTYTFQVSEEEEEEDDDDEEDRINLQSLGRLAELEHLTVRGDVKRYCRPLFPAGAGNPKLKELHLSKVCCASDSSEIREYISNAPKLRMITLRFCSIHTWAELFNTIHSKGMCRLKMYFVFNSKSETTNFNECLDSLQYLKLKRCMMPKNFLLTLFGICPQLRELHLAEMENVCDAVVMKLCQKLKNLRKLTLNKCAITDASVKHIIEHGLRLEQLSIRNCGKLTPEGVALLKAANLVYIDVRNDPQRYQTDGWFDHASDISSDDD